jgi:hypothetical protein
MSAADKAAQQAVRLHRGLLKYRCLECGRVFDLLDEDDVAEVTYGHDCEVN